MDDIISFYFFIWNANDTDSMDFHGFLFVIIPGHKAFFPLTVLYCRDLIPVYNLLQREIMLSLTKTGYMNIITRVKRIYKFWFLVLITLSGAVVGIVILYPLNDLAYYLEYGPENMPLGKYVLNSFIKAITFAAPVKTLFYMVAGIILGLISAFIYRAFMIRVMKISQLNQELAKDIHALIKQGEGPELEFKSSLRWDYNQSGINKALEGVIIKTIAGFMNSSSGGTLLIGVDDEGNVLGLENDFKSLKKQNRDGFEQVLVSLISIKLGADVCRFVETVFYQMDGRDICRLIVAPSQRPVYIDQGNNVLKFYLRTGGGTRELNIREAMDYIADRWSKK